MEEDINLDGYDTVIGIDPGVKKTLTLVRRINNTQKSIIEEKNEAITSHRMNLSARNRMCKQRKYTMKFDDMIAKYLSKQEEQPSAKSTNYTNFVDFKLKFFTSGTAAYMKKKITKLHFQKYVDNQKDMSNLCKKVEYFFVF